jgi:hypothetical protein
MAWKSPWRARPVIAALVLSMAGPGSLAAADLCAGLPVDKSPHPMSALARPAPGAAVVDPEFGAVIRRITAVSASGDSPAIVPLYSTVSAWNADESRLILYHVGKGHELYDGRTYRFIRALDIDPANVEQVYWHTTDPDVLFYVSGNRLVRYHVGAGVKETLHTFSFCAGPVSGGSDPMFTSFDSDVIGLQCDGRTFFYRLHDDTVTVLAKTTLPSVQAAPSGTLGWIGGYVVDLGLKVQRQLDLANPWEHASLGRLADGDDAYHAVAFDPGPRGSGIGSLVTHDMRTGESEVVVGPATGYPYPPLGTHVSGMAYRQPGWVFLSIVGDPAGQGVLDNEIVVADAGSGRVCRAAHHRSWGRDNTQLADPYWAEPHVVASPSGTRAVFASDWGDGGTVDTYALELPVHQTLTATLVADHPRPTAGQKVTFSASIHNPGLPAQVDLYFLIVLPDGQQVVAFGPSGAVLGAWSKPASWPAVSTRLGLGTAFDSFRPAFYSLAWSASLPRGTYRFILLLTEAGSLADGRIDGSDVRASGVSEVTYTP